MPRLSKSKKVWLSWEVSNQKWPPNIGEKVRLWSPMWLRGEVAEVIATQNGSIKGYSRIKSERIQIMFSESDIAYATRYDVFPYEHSLSIFDKDVFWAIELDRLIKDKIIPDDSFVKVRRNTSEYDVL